MRFRARVRSVALLAVVAVSCLTAGGIAVAAARHHAHRQLHGTRSALSAAAVRRLERGARHRSIILFRNQLTRLPARRANLRARGSAIAAVQSNVRAELARVHAARVHSYRIINAISASITSAEATRLQADPAVRAVVPDVVRPYPVVNTGPGPALGAMAGSSAPAGSQQICPSSPSQPIIEPEARDVMNVDAAERIADGSGVKVGIIADGIDPNNPDLIRANGQPVIFDYQDFSGFGNGSQTDGREAFLDAGTIASQANRTYDLSKWVNPAHPLPPNCDIKIKGIAPGASLALLNIFGPSNGASDSTIIQAIQWAVLDDHVNVLNESFGGNPLPDTQNDPVALADRAAVAAGVTVVASSGDSGPFNTEGSPATTPGVLSVAATTTYRVYRQTGRYGTSLVPGGWENNNISGLSSSGVTEFGPETVDVAAPGDRGWSLCGDDTTKYTGCVDIDKGSDPPPIWAAGGTSASAPETSGTAALVIEAYAKAHGGALPSPQLVKQIIVSTAQDLGAPAENQGAGLVNTLKAVQLAQSMGAGGTTSNTLLLTPTQLSATLDAGQSQTFHVGVTNESDHAVTVSPTVSGSPTTTSADTGTVNLSASSPTFVDGEGNTDHYAAHTFTVAPGADYLNGNITWNGAGQGGNVEETLFDPQGRVAAYSLIGADETGFTHVEVREPAAGKWTAIIFEVGSAPYTGPVQFSYQTEDFHGVGASSPPVTLAAGQSGSVRVTVPAGQPGDRAYRLHLGTGASTDGSIPIVVRSLVSLSRQGGTFAGNLTGGGDEERFTYQFRLPGNAPELNLGIALNDPDYNVVGLLTDPNGEPLDVQSTTTFDAAGNPSGFGRTLQFFRADPQAGLWTLSLVVAGPVDGSHLSEPYSGRLSFAPPAVRAIGIPSSPRVALRRGRTVTALVRLTNTGNTSKDYFLDPRLYRRAPQLLLGSDATNVALPLTASPPLWFVPPGTNALAVAGQGTVPLTVGLSAAFGDPAVQGVSVGPNASVAFLHAPEVAPGVFGGDPAALGPFPDSGVSGSVNMAAIANTYLFDSAVSSSTGDLWAETVDPTATAAPVTVAPGASTAVPVAITPSGRRGSVVRGFIGVDTANSDTGSGDEVALIPYAYRIR